VRATTRHILTIAVIALLLTACTGGATPGGSRETPPASGGTLRIVDFYYGTFDPQKSYEPSQWEIFRRVPTPPKVPSSGSSR